MQSDLAENNNQSELLNWVTVAFEAAESKLGERTTGYFVGEVLGVTDWFIVTSAQNTRQVKAIVDDIEEKVFAAGGPKPKSVEGKENLGWVLMDFASFVVHVFTAESREYYDLDRLWKDTKQLG